MTDMRYISDTERTIGTLFPSLREAAVKYTKTHKNHIGPYVKLEHNVHRNKDGNFYVGSTRLAKRQPVFFF